MAKVPHAAFVDGRSAEGSLGSISRARFHLPWRPVSGGYRVKVQLRDYQVMLVSAVGMGQKVVTLDLFDKPETCRKAWGRLLSGFVMDALEQRSANERQAQAADAERLVTILQSAPWKQVEAVGEGEEYRAEVQTGEHATKLCLGGSVVHASVLAGT